MCADGDRVPGSVAEALRAAHECMDYLNGPDAALLDPAALGGVLTSLAEIQAKFTAAHAAFLRRFDAADAHDADGYGTSSAWLAAMTRLKAADARAAVARMRTLGRHPHLSDAMAAGQISPSWVAEIDRLTRKLPAELRGETDTDPAGGRRGRRDAGGPGPAGRLRGGAVPVPAAQPRRRTMTGSMSGSCRSAPRSAGRRACGGT